MTNKLHFQGNSLQIDSARVVINIVLAFPVSAKLVWDSLMNAGGLQRLGPFFASNTLRPYTWKTSPVMYYMCFSPWPRILHDNWAPVLINTNQYWATPRLVSVWGEEGQSARGGNVDKKCYRPKLWKQVHTWRCSEISSGLFDDEKMWRYKNQEQKNKINYHISMLLYCF